MEKLKGKYEIILGFVTLVLSFSAFKEEINSVILDFGYAQVNLTNVFWGCIIGFSISLYFYVLELALRDTAIGGWKIFNLLLTIGFYAFCFILFLPIFILINLSVAYILHNKDNMDFEYLRIVLSILSSITSGVLFYIVASQFYKVRKNKIEEEKTIREIDHLERAKNLINDSYYHHAIFEMYTVLVSALRRNLESKGYRISEQRIDQLSTAALNEGLINQDESNFLKLLRNQRNQVAHSLQVDFDVTDATQVLVRVTQILQRLK